MYKCACLWMAMCAFVCDCACNPSMCKIGAGCVGLCVLCLRDVCAGTCAYTHVCVRVCGGGGVWLSVVVSCSRSSVSHSSMGQYMLRSLHTPE